MVFQNNIKLRKTLSINIGIVVKNQSLLCRKKKCIVFPKASVTGSVFGLGGLHLLLLAMNYNKIEEALRWMERFVNLL